MKSPLVNRRILVTGGTGSFGRAFVRHALWEGATWVAVLSRDEKKQWEMKARMSRDDRTRCRWFIGSVTDQERVARALSDVDLLVHAAAMKQIPACEENPAEAVDTNVMGTKAVALAAIAAGVERAVFLSTDKAAAPNTHYGACKLAAERLWTQSNVYAAGRRTRLVATRYGNVVGSRGSVVELWRGQLAAGEKLTVTDATMTRFWMRMAEAVGLVELALREGRGGEVFVPKVKAAGIMTLLEAVAGGPHAFETVGIRRNEKQHETLITEDEARDTYDHGTHYRIEPERTWVDEALFTPGARVDVKGGWSYRSDTAEQLTAANLREML